MNGNGKRIVTLCLLLVVGGGWAGLASRYTTPEPTEPAASAATGSSLHDPNAPPLNGIGFEGGGLFPRIMLAVVIVLVFGAAALYLSKKVLPRMANTAGREIRVVETTCLGPRKALHLVEVGSQRLLIASTADRITMLTPVGDTWLDVPKQPADGVVEV